MFFWLTLKVDFECPNERRLGELELAALLDNGGAFSRVECTLQTRYKIPEVLCSSEYLYSVEADFTTAVRIIRRASYWHSVIVPLTITDDEQIEISGFIVRQTAEHLEALTASTILERSAYPNFALENIAADEGYLVTGKLNSRAVRRKMVKGAHDRKRNVYLSHDFHKYKAKFFPRMTRALINITCPKDHDTLLDPFCGSGTANVEAALIGVRSIGLDIDPLSAFIARQKTSLEVAATQDVIDVLIRLKGRRAEIPEEIFANEYRLPKFLLRERAKHLTGLVAKDLEADVGSALSTADGIENPIARDLYRLAISHALATKVSLRWMGTGDNRFSVEVAKRAFTATLGSQVDLIRRRLEDYRRLRQAGLQKPLGPTSIGTADVTDLPLPNDSVDGIVTSPPYLPASSGRETYLRSRAASLVALGLMTEEQVMDRESGLLGSIMARPTGLNDLPPDVVDLVKWMQPQRARAPKALPTAAYFERMSEALAQMARVLKPGGKIAFVVSRFHTFYELSSKNTVAQLDMVKNVRLLIEGSKGSIPLRFLEAIDIELGKADFVARPASQGSYFESVIILERIEDTAAAPGL